MARIPGHLAGVKRALALESWVKRKRFRRAEYFTSIDSFRAAIAALPHRQGGEESDDDSLRLALAALVNRDGEFLDYVIEKGTYDITEPQRWQNACEALAATIINRYEKAVEAGEWQ